MRLIHYSENPLGELRNMDQMPPQHYFDKPKGLWVSAEGEGDWLEWCRDNSFGETRLQFENVIELHPDARILRLQQAVEMLQFTADYGVMGEIGKQVPLLGRSLAIDWPRVASEYQGILIAPYTWSLRMDTVTSWYYPWDCASGCIWDVSAIQSVTSRKMETVENADSEREQGEVSEGLASD